MLEKSFAGIVLFIAGLLVQPGFSEAAVPFGIRVEPNHVLMGASYNGVKVSISGEIPLDTEALVRVIGSMENSTFKKKGRALGLLWMNLGKVVFHRIPSVFLLYPSKALKEFSLRERQQWLRLGLGLDALKERVDITPASEDKSTLFQEFVKLKQTWGLYGTWENAVCYKRTRKSMKSFTATLALPSDLPHGVYKVEAFAIRDGVIIARASELIKAQEVGLPAFLSSLAFRHGTLYGVISVLVAILAGLLTRVIFKGGKGVH